MSGENSDRVSVLALENDYVIRVLKSPLEVSASAWNALLQTQSDANLFMRHEYLAALHTSGAAITSTGWTPRFISLWRGGELVAACPLYVKAHSYGEYVFDWAWANAYHQHGLEYYPKVVIAVPFTPVPGARLLARTAEDRQALVKQVLLWCKAKKVSSLHLLFGNEDDVSICIDNNLMQRHTVQFHWTNSNPGYADFDAFLATLSQEKRKKIRRERRKVAEAGVTFRWSRGADIRPADWDFFYRCYERTYLEHGNAPYLSLDFFREMQATMPDNWLLFVAMQNQQAIATSLIAINSYHSTASGTNDAMSLETGREAPQIAYGRYWGALKRVDCLHFEACYYQPLAWCIQHGFARFEGGAQGEHKMARALMPVKTHSAHWLAHPAFADAIEKFLAREGAGIDGYMRDLESRTPFKTP